MCLKSNGTGAIKFLLTTEIQINIIPLKVVLLGRYTPPETLLTLPVALLEVFLWKCPQLVCHDLLDVVHSSQNDHLWGGIWFREKKKSYGLRTGEYGGFGNIGILFLVEKNSFAEMVVWQEALSWYSIQVHAISGRTWWTPFFESFKDVTIVLFISYSSMRHEFLLNSNLTVEKTN